MLTGRSRFARKISNLSFAAVLTIGTALPYGASAFAATADKTLENSLNLEARETLAPAVISSEVDTQSSRKQRVIVQFSREPLAASLSEEGLGFGTLEVRSAEQAIDTQQSSFVKQAKKLGVNVVVNYTYDTVLNGMEITVAAKDIPKLASIAGVTSIDPNQQYYEIPVDEAAGASMRDSFELSPLKQIGADQAWAQGFTGKGLKVGVIDTGVDYLHPDLKDAYKGGYDSFEKDADPYEEPPIVIDGTTYAGTSHGTHVSGTIVGRGTNPTSELVQKGVAYEADLYVYKVLGRNIETGRASGSSAQVIDGIEHAVKDGMDVINLSLGSDSNKDPNSPDAVAINNAVLSGVTAIVANGNAADEGPYYYSMGSPATSQLAIAVGAVTTETNHYKAEFSASVGETPAAENQIEQLTEEAPAPAREESEAAAEGAEAAAEAEAQPAASEEQAASGGEQPAEPEEQATAETADASAAEDFAAATVSQAVYGDYGPYTTDILAWKTGREDFAAQFGTGPNDAVYANLGADADYDKLAEEGVDVAGKVVVVSRGALTFDAKVRGAAAHGAKAIVIFNGNTKPGSTKEADLSESIPGRDEPVGSVAFLGDSFNYVPYFDMSGTEGRKLARQALELDTPEFEITFGSDYPKTVVEGDRMASFSSRGPNGDDNLSIKPDVVAPGVNILSTYPEYGKSTEGVSYDEAYARSNGTSMAAPHVAGLALLLKQKHPEWTPFDVRAALANTADEIVDEEGTPYDVYSQGAGRADVAAALNTPALLQAVEEIRILNTDLVEVPVTNYSPSISFGVMAAGSAEASRSLQLKSVTGGPVSYSASVLWHNSVTSDPNDPIATPDPSKISARLTGLGAGDTVSASGGAPSAFGLTIAPAADAAKGVYEGEVLLQSAGSPDLHLPFVLHVGDEQPATGFGIQDVEVSNRIITPDGDGDRDTTDVSFTLSADNVNYIQIAAYGINDEYIGTLDKISVPDDSGEMLEPKRYTFKNIGDEYVNERTGNEGKLAKGAYQLEIYAVHMTPEGPAAEYYAYSSYRIAEGGSVLVDEAAAAFDKKAAVVNTTAIGLNVLDLKSTDKVKFAVTASDRPNLIDANGVLRALPTQPTTVNLDVKVSYIPNETFSETLTVPVVLLPGQPATGGGSSDGGAAGGGVSGGGGSAPVSTAPAAPAAPAAGAPTVEQPAVPASSSAVANAAAPAGQRQIVIVPTLSDRTGASVKAGLTDAALAEALKTAGGSAASLIFSVPVQSGQGAEVSITSAQLQKLAAGQSGTALVIDAGTSAVSLPANLFAILPQDVSLRMNIARAEEEKAKFASYADGASVIGSPVAFELQTVDAAGKASDVVSTGSVFVPRSFVVDAAIPAGGAGVLYEENGRLNPVASKFQSQPSGGTIATVSRPGFSTYAVVSSPATFKDIQGSWARGAIENLSGKLLINGTSDTSFSPKRSITRAEFAALLVRSLGLGESSETPFADVKAEDWFAADVAAAYRAGLISGTGSGKFDPDAAITREQLAVLLTNAAQLLELKTEGSGGTYADASEFSAYAKEEIGYAAAYGLMQGNVRGGRSYFDPKAPATREAAALTLQNLLGKAGMIEQK
ncbi:S8 family serine peptidase [Saccharibacillus alkalitolerans]|uniref:S8 family serine peptidase n=1 Tax=Saccharibacillus alkalitolerans TaxID=2705290 RepID=UPI001F26ACCF|nr:S8 family serine peptidase [Saccharibacillus alkalitolerans]